MHSDVARAAEFRTGLGFNPYDIMTKEQSVLTKIMKIFAKNKILIQHYDWYTAF